MRRVNRLEPSGVGFAVAVVLAVTVLCQLPALAGADFDTGLRLFKVKRYAEAAKSFEKAAAETPWESSPLYYAALAYHYAGDYKHASEKYDGLVQKFPGTSACNNAMAALKVVDPGYFRRKEAEKAGKYGGQSSSASAASSASQDTGTVEGELQTRVYVTKQGDDKLVDAKVGGRGIRVILDQHGEDTAFTPGQLSALGVQASGKQARVDLAIGGVVRKNFPVTVDPNVGSTPKVGNSFLNAFICDFDSAGNYVDLKRKSAASAQQASGNQVNFRREGKDVIVDVSVNGRSTGMIFDPQGSGIQMSVKAAKGLGLKVDEAEEAFRSPAEGPQRGEPGWIPPDERPPASKYIYVQRVKLGPVDKTGVQIQINEKDSRYPKVGADLVSGWKFDIDYQASVIRFRR